MRNPQQVLLVRPDGPGGVGSYYRSLSPYLQDVTVCRVGSRHDRESSLERFIRLLTDFARFLFYLYTTPATVVHLNPSLEQNALIRDGLKILIASWFGKTILVFFRGWVKEMEHELQGWKLRLFQLVFQRADQFIVLATSFRKKLRKWGFHQPVKIETTTVDQELVEGIDVPELISDRKNKKPFRLLFLSRIIKEKGIFQILRTLKSLRGKRRIKLEIAGSGPDFDHVLSYVQKNDLSDLVRVHGYVRGEEKSSLFSSSHLYLLPTTYGEGLPNAILEAMAFGLPVITTRVGGIPDHIESKKNGILLDAPSVDQLTEAIEFYLDNPEQYEQTAKINFKKARSSYLSSRVAERLNEIYKQLSTEPAEAQ